MRPIGFSSGALAYSNFRRALAMLNGRNIHAVELSALRQPELIPLVESLDGLDLSQFSYISFHAPSQIRREDEEAVVELLAAVGRRGWPVILHPDAVWDFSQWKQLGNLLCVENMDRRKPIGRTADELAKIFQELPDASFCFDIGHARQVDSTMTEAYFILKNFGERLRQVHVSEVNTRSKHDPLSFGAILAFREVAHMLPKEVPLILETPVSEAELETEMHKAMDALRPPLKTVAAD
jgi:hypothetical protein